LWSFLKSFAVSDENYSSQNNSVSNVIQSEELNSQSYISINIRNSFWEKVVPIFSAVCSGRGKYSPLVGTTFPFSSKYDFRMNIYPLFRDSLISISK